MQKLQLKKLYIFPFITCVFTLFHVIYILPHANPDMIIPTSLYLYAWFPPKTNVTWDD